MSELLVGPEIEFTHRFSDAEPLTGVADSDHDMGHITPDLPEGTVANYESFTHSGHHGTEIRPEEPIPIYEAPRWYETVLDVAAEHGYTFEPTGLVWDESNGFGTAGLHIHVSPLPEDYARRLYVLSQRPWMHVFCATSVVRHQTGVLFPLVRSLADVQSFCDLDNFSPGRYNGFANTHCAVVNHRGDEHWEWRLPEPMLPDHFRLIVGFIARFADDPDDAAEWAYETTMAGDDQLTAIQRARNIGMTPTEADHYSASAQTLERITA